MMFVSFNVNSIRTRLHQLEAVIDSLNPDFIGLQETKVTDEEFPEDAIRELGYHVHFHGQKTHYGVALLSRQAPDSVQKGYPWDGEDSQRRLITGHFTVNGRKLTVINGYFPQGESRDHPVKFPAKEKFYADLMRYLDDLKAANGEIVVMGDMNISPTDQDIGIGADNAKRWLRTGKCSFLPEEREWLGQVESRGFTDVFRHLHPEESDTFSWFDYRSKGFDRDPRRGLRIDLIMASDPLLPKAEEAGVSYDIRAMERPSDHCPVWARFSL
ncbi:exodeoxyribonuclease III [Marinobacter salarius]|jgi:exodeoxyribonuclease-3|uniref:Exodeoxyribonuclease III n=1 Tax=Marinobacter salarius TaxID=1420917 RepID=W5YPX6_9GAMM|nr:exodeoxyribonuclease III [Marinobacter salarius]AHI31277.1 exodeoxyribonuclease III [Marinobacter salarius]MBJ7278590.1 exodeoxyribonuclease III [Marinobacter salarius]MCC4282261.1 exodeoxyribonuclease III [Marinobacter salarius]MDP4532622.1 exodeoxyribonuclease III [Marinobacter salarius]|tara:strand:- start:12051 stop:12863 length:813 start_codon:yes stop_codon:yes gene_type:complete